ncbi:MAG TPA: DHHW family protein [Clostridia bacterium]|nr:DHHW family protein [Clostridia bacterium]
MEKKNEKRRFPISAAVNVLLVSGLLSAMGLISVLYGNRPTMSEIEKRDLAPWPVFSASSLMHGQYTKQLSAYFADTFPGREELVKLAGSIREQRGFRFSNVWLYDALERESKIDSNLPLLPDNSTAPAALPAAGYLPERAQSEKTQETSAPERVESASSAVSMAADAGLPLSLSVDEVGPVNSVEEGVRMGAIFMYKESGYTIFGGSNQMGQWYAQVLNAYQSVLGDHIKLYNIVVPSSIEFNLPARYRSVTTPQKPKLENIAASLDPAITWVNVYDTLAQHKKDYLYYRTDHHWSTLGAYYAYVEFSKAAGFEPVPLEKMEKRTLDNFLGTLYAQTQNSIMASKPDFVDYYIMPTAYKCFQYRKGSPDIAIRIPLYGEYAKSYNSYSVFMHGDFPVTVIDTEVKNGRRIAVVKESFGNAFVPFLVNHYETVVVIDQRYLEKSFYDVLNEFNINELLFINNIAAAHTAVRIQELASLPNRIYIPPEPDAVSEDVGQTIDPQQVADQQQAQSAVGQQQEKS